MATDQLIERRLTALEQAVADLRKRLPGRTASPDWIRRIAGSVSDADAFDEVLGYGREFRRSDRPVDESEKAE